MEGFVQGNCLQMCPPREISLRAEQRCFHFFETVSFTSNSNTFSNEKNTTADPAAMVKEFSRSAAGKCLEPSNLRPSHVLQQTMNYLVEKIASKDGVFTWQKIYDFMFDRIRAIRQDLVVQGITGKHAVDIFEKTCRFHILSNYKLCESPPEVFDSKINNDHTSECLKRLLSLYDDEHFSVYKNTRGEFEAYYLLYNLGSLDALGRALTLPEEIKENWLLQLSIEINLTAILKNFVRFFRLVKRLPYLACCAVHKQFNQVRVGALTSINKAYYTRNASIPFSLFVQMLNFNNIQEAKDFCTHHGLEVLDTAVKPSKGDLSTSRTLHARFSNLINEKCSSTASDLISGKGTIPPMLRGSSVHMLPTQLKGRSASGNVTEIMNLSSVLHPVTSQPRPSWFGKMRGRGRGWGRGQKTMN